MSHACSKIEGTHGGEEVRRELGQEAPRHRAGAAAAGDVYPDSDPTHIIQEAIDNAADEAFGGHADRIDVTVHGDGSVTVTDNGRGIPVGMHPEEKIPTVQLVLTELHAGAKFSRTDADAAYKFSGGLHGVGVSVTNALSERLEVEMQARRRAATASCSRTAR